MARKSAKNRQPEKSADQGELNETLSTPTHQTVFQTDDDHVVGDTDSKAGTAKGRGGKTVKKEDETHPLTKEQAQTLADLVSEYESTIETLAKLEKANDEALTTKAQVFHRRALVIHKIIDGKLYAGSHPSAEAYFEEKWKIARSHVYRLAKAGGIIARYQVSPAGDAEPLPLADTLKLLATESHFRPLTKLTEAQHDAVLAKIAKWIEITGNNDVTPKMVSAAVVITTHVARPAQAGVKTKRQKAIECVKALKSKLEADVLAELHADFAQLENLIEIPAKTGISWTEATWNIVHGCSWASPACDNCYAAQWCATRWVHLYPGLAKACQKDNKKTYRFTGVIKLQPDILDIPLKDRTPKRYFVNAFSDTFHKDVPEEFLAEAFEVMEKANWHVFQILTKRPEQMAKFVAKRYGDKQAPAHIWFGTTIEDQERLDERLPHLLNINAAVRWLSIEPLLGALNLPSLDGIHWVIVGGESGRNARKMDKAWVTPIRDACEEAGIPFFFKQWGAYGEDGKKLKTEQEPVTLDGEVHKDYPDVDAHEDEEPCPLDEGATPVIDDGDTKQKQAA